MGEVKELALAYQRFLDAISSEAVTIEQLQYAEEAYKLEFERFMLGVSDIVRHTEATEDIIKSRSEMVQAKYTLTFQRLFREYVVGSLTVSKYQ